MARMNHFGPEDYGIFLGGNLEFFNRDAGYHIHMLRFLTIAFFFG